MGAKVAELECDGNYCGFSQNNIDLNLPVAATERENFPLKGKTLQSSNLGLAQTGLQTKPHHMQKKELSKERDATKVSLGHQQGDFFSAQGV